MRASGVDRVVSKLRSRAKAVGGPATGGVEYTAPYAIHVHENLETYHPNGQAKYLEQPARTMREQLFVILHKRIRAGGTMAQAVLEAMQALKEASQLLVPVRTGFLRDSAREFVQ